MNAEHCCVGFLEAYLIHHDRPEESADSGKDKCDLDQLLHHAGVGVEIGAIGLEANFGEETIGHAGEQHDKNVPELSAVKSLNFVKVGPICNDGDAIITYLTTS